MAAYYNLANELHQKIIALEEKMKNAALNGKALYLVVDDMLKDKKSLEKFIRLSIREGNHEGKTMNFNHND